MAKRRKDRGATPTADKPDTANGRPLSARAVASPYGNGVDLVACVPETVAILHGKGKLDDRQAAAAERYRLAVEAVSASLSAAVGTHRVDTSGHGGGFTDKRLQAARDLATARTILGMHEWVVRRVVAEGGTLARVASRLPGGDCRATRSAASLMLATSLELLADVWEPVARGACEPVLQSDVAGG